MNTDWGFKGKYQASRFCLYLRPSVFICGDNFFAGRSRQIFYNRGMSEFLCIEIGGTKLQIFRGDEKGFIGEPWKAPADRIGGGPAISRQILEGIAALRSQGAGPTAIAVGFGGPVDFARGTIVRSHQIEGWEDFPLRDWLSKETGLPV